ncbi:thioesterase family protein [Streptomyces sp. B21-101]|uniref:thioesterase family protein n=1 Tax=Streptomyces sp. B21-101 TaxID=3039415 RepID=UPI002FF0EC85
MKPSYQEVNALCSVIEDRVGSAFTDGNGHMNVRHIYAYGVAGADLLSEQVGITDTYRSACRMGTFAAEHHIRFFAELREKDSFSVHPLWIDRSERVGHVLVFILNRTTRMLSSVLELVVINMDLNSRSSVPFPPDIAAEIDQRVAATRAIPWPIPTSGAMGVRR